MVFKKLSKSPLFWKVWWLLYKKDNLNLYQNCFHSVVAIRGSVCWVTVCDRPLATQWFNKYLHCVWYFAFHTFLTSTYNFWDFFFIQVIVGLIHSFYHFVIYRIFYIVYTVYNSDSCHSFSLLEAIAKGFPLLFAIAFKS